MAKLTLTAKVPSKLTVLVTHRCNQRCEFCFDASNVVSARACGDISDKTVERLVQVLAASGVSKEKNFNVTLSGGEPTLHPGFFEILARFSDAGYALTVLSNGQAFADENFVRRLLKYHLWNVQVAVEGSTAAMHDDRVGCPGAFNRCVKGIKNLLANGVRFITNTTITRRSIDEMYRIIDLLDELGVPKMNIGNMLPECCARNHALLMEYPDVVAIAENLNLYALTKRIDFSFITPLPLCLKNHRFISNPSVCSAGAYSLIMDPSGQFRPCSTWTFPDIDYPNVHAVATIEEVRRTMKGIVQSWVGSHIPTECSTCEDLPTCRAACPLYWAVAGARTPSCWVETAAAYAALPSKSAADDRRRGSKEASGALH